MHPALGALAATASHRCPPPRSLPRVRDENRARRVHGTCKDGMMRSIRRCKQRASVTRGRQRARMRLTSLLEPCVKGLSTCREDLLVREGGHRFRNRFFARVTSHPHAPVHPTDGGGPLSAPEERVTAYAYNISFRVRCCLREGVGSNERRNDKKRPSRRSCGSSRLLTYARALSLAA